MPSAKYIILSISFLLKYSLCNALQEHVGYLSRTGTYALRDESEEMDI